MNIDLVKLIIDKEIKKAEEIVEKSNFKILDPELFDFYGTTPLICAIQNDEINLSKKIIERGANIDFRDISAKTALMYAAEKNQIELVRLLIEKGADLKKTDDYGKNALAYSIEGKYSEISEYIIEKSNKERLSKAWGGNGKTPLSLSLLNNEIKTAKLLISKNVNIDYIDCFGKTALNYTALTNNLEGLKLLIKNGANVNITDKNGNGALSFLIEQNNLEGVKTLNETQKVNYVDLKIKQLEKLIKWHEDKKLTLSNIHEITKVIDEKVKTLSPKLCKDKNVKTKTILIERC